MHLRAQITSQQIDYKEAIASLQEDCNTIIVTYLYSNILVFSCNLIILQ